MVWWRWSQAADAIIIGEYTNASGLEYKRLEGLEGCAV